MTSVSKKMKKCPECGSKKILEDKTRGEVVCKNCGLVIKDSIIDRGQEWRAFDAEQVSKRARTGAPRTYTKHDKGLTTEIGKSSGELFKVPRKKRAQYYRLRKWHKRLVESKNRNLSFALSELQRIISFLNLPKPVHERVARYYEQVVDEGLVRGRSIESVIAALVYTISREERTPRTLNEIGEVCGLEKKDIGRTYRYVARELKIRILPADPKDFVPRFCSILKLSSKVETRSINILKKAKKKGIISGKSPIGVAAAAIHIACLLGNEERTQREIANAISITEVTLKNRQKEIINKLKISL